MAEMLPQRLPVGAMDTRASGWWAMIFTVFTEASLFAYLLFSYFYLAVQPHAPGTFPEGGAPALGLAGLNTAILLAESEDRFISQSRRDFYDVWLPSLAPSEALLKLGQCL